MSSGSRSHTLQDFSWPVKVYLDNCATTAVAPEVAAAMAEFMNQGFGNPASPHLLGQAAAEAIDEARRVVAHFIGAAAEVEIFFTSGGTEANNLALKGAARAAGAGKHLVASAIEHSSVIDALVALEHQGWRATMVPVSGAGVVDPEAVLAVVGPDTVCVSLMQVNNEVGSIQPVAELGRLLKERHPKVLFHIDAVQAAGKLPIDVDHFGADLLTLSAHKLHGPKGVGALYVRAGTRLLPILHGGLQQRGLRPGTENVPGIVGFRVALELADVGETSRLEVLRDRLAAGLGSLPTVRVNGPLGNSGREQAAPHVLNVSFLGVPAQLLIEALSDQGVYVSARSACLGHARESHVLAAMGLGAARRRSAIRLCVSRLNTVEEIDAAAEIIGYVVEELLLQAAPT